MASFDTFRQLDTDTLRRVERSHQKGATYFHRLANEPSLGLYFVDEHARKSVKKMAVDRHKLSQLHEKVEASSEGVEICVTTVGHLNTSHRSFLSISQKLASATQCALSLAPPPSSSGL
eukprot:TRINITY_DN4944_c0_g1_i1.p1 TRINITY_DN4944_c0_g1~~TRINITY_DN4944_c0_g1_i1.p1  ORF type:complete len:119 (-),score=46.98 TRINITY_DN4944_c0_g1_i1:53-409(-)